MSRQTPAGREREHMTGLIMDHPDADNARFYLVEAIGPQTVHDEERNMRANGAGGMMGVQALCRMASNSELEEVMKQLGIK